MIINKKNICIGRQLNKIEKKRLIKDEHARRKIKRQKKPRRTNLA
jgi:hypothetical protein